MCDGEYQSSDIVFTNKFKTLDDKERTRISFKTEEIKARVYAAKRKLKEKRIYLAEDLTLYRSKIYFLARKAMANKHITATWTMEGKIFIKKGEIRKAKKVITHDEILEYCQSEE